MDVEAELDRLYSLPLDEFTSARNALAKQIDDAELTKRVKQLKKPSVAAWAMNQLARKHADQIRELLSIRDELEKARSPKQLRDLSSRRREVVAGLTRMTKNILETSPHGASHTTLEKVSQGLLAGGSEEETELLATGRLTREPTASGLDAFGLGGEVEDVEEEASRSVPLKTQRAVDRLRRDAERLQQDAARLAQEASFAEQQARRARKKAEEAAAAADAARAKAQDAAEDAGL